MRLLVLLTAVVVCLPAAVTIHSDFEGGSIGRVEQVSPGHFRCAVQGEVDQDKRNRQASWYYFRVDGAAGHEITLDLTDLPGEYNYRPGNLAINGATRPFISYDGEQWSPLPDSAVEWDQSLPLLRLRLTPEHSPVWIAHVPPYTTARLSRFVDEIRANPNVDVAEIGKSAGARGLLMITATNRAIPAAQKKVLWLMARQHAWEAGTSWVMEGALRAILSNTPESGRLRDAFIFKCFPMADPDGVARGGVRFNAHGYDLNRNWDVADPNRMPEIAALRQTVLGWVDAGHRVDLFVSLHNDNNDYMEGPLTAAGPDFRHTIQRLAATLAKDTVFEGKGPRDWAPGEPAPGRADACQQLFLTRGIRTLLIEQNVQTNAKLRHPAGNEDYLRFGRLLLPALASAIEGGRESRNLVPNPDFKTGAGELPVDWTVWSPRETLRPRARVIPDSGGNLLSLESASADQFGKWQTVVAGIRPGQAYQFEVSFRPREIRSETVSLPVILTWCSDAHGKTMVQRDFVEQVERNGEWRRTARTLTAPARAASLRVELGLRWTARGSVLWRGPRLEAVEARPHRKVRVATTHLVPGRSPTVESNLALMTRALDEAGARKADVVVLSENFLDRGVRRPVEETAQTIPGPATDLLSRKAKQYSTYVATSLHEREGDLIFNTAVLIDRSGRIVGKYRKTHLAMIEGENGITPGNDYPLFATDFGKVGLLVCWDNWFSEPARILRLKGAEILLLPIAGDGDVHHWDIISRARAIDNGVYLVASSTVGDSPSRVIDPSGEILAETAEPFGVAVAEIDLDQERRLNWLSVGPGDGEARSLYIQERRPETYGPLTEEHRD